MLNKDELILLKDSINTLNFMLTAALETVAELSVDLEGNAELDKMLMNSHLRKKDRIDKLLNKLTMDAG